MGAWGVGSFENDGGNGFLADLFQGDDLRPVADAFDTVLSNDDYIEVYEAQAVVAAGEVVALMQGAAGSSLPDKLIVWQQAHPLPVDEALIRQAIRAVDKVYTRSEMRELWEEVADFPVWQSAVQNLLTRLKSNVV